jgi:Zn-dependent protease/CBS domain-containing protein
MFRSTFTLFRIAGIAIRVDASWIILVVLVTWSLAAAFFPAQYPKLTRETYWTMGALGAIGLFASILFHELSHALMARRRGVRMNGITLFIFGGVAEMESEPEDARTELLTALAGPAATVVLLLVLWPLAILSRSQEWPLLIQATVSYLAIINLVLLVFNAIPAFPLDGGRVLRAVLWSRKGDVQRATRIASQVGSGFGLLLIIMGVARVIGGDFIGGMWSFLIGSFLRTAATTAYQQTLLRESLRGATVREFMKADVVTVPREIPVRELVDDYFYKHHHRMFPVLANGKLTGCVSTRDVAKLPPDEWSNHTAGSIASPCIPDATITADAEAVDALAQMHRTGQSRLLVMDGDQVVGILTLKDLLRFLGMKMELEGRKGT